MPGNRRLGAISYGIARQDWVLVERTEPAGHVERTVICSDLTSQNTQ